MEEKAEFQDMPKISEYESFTDSITLKVKAKKLEKKVIRTIFWHDKTKSTLVNTSKRQL